MIKQDSSRCSVECIKNIGENAPELQEQVQKSLRNIRYEKGETIYKQGAFAQQFACINKGLVKLQISNEKHRHLIFRIAGKGDVIGLSSLSSPNDFSFSAIALKDTTVCLFESRTISSLIPKSENIRQFVIDSLAREQKLLSEKLAFIALHQMQGKLAHALIYLNQKKFLKEDIFSWITRKEIAQLAGMSQESMNKILKDLRADGLIAIKDGKIMLTNKTKLEHLARMG